MCIFPGTLAEDELPEIVAKVTNTIEEVGGQHIHATDVEKNRLAYPMKHIRYGYFAYFIFEMEPTQVPTLTHKLRLMSGMLRTLINAYDPSMKQALEDRLAEIKRRIENRVGMSAAPVEEEPETTKEAPAPKKEKTPAPTKEETKETETKEEEPEEKVDMQDIDKKLDALLDDTVSSL